MMRTFFPRLQILGYISIEEKELVVGKKLKIYERRDH